MDIVGTISGLLIALIVTLCYILLISFTLWMAIDAGKQDRFWWLTLVIGLPVIGATVYYFTEKKHEYAKAPVHHLHTSETEEQHEKSPKKKKSKKKKEEDTGVTLEELVGEEKVEVKTEEVVQVPAVETPQTEQVAVPEPVVTEGGKEEKTLV